MQRNFSTIKTMRKPSKLETTVKHVKTAHKGKTWQRGTDKREMYNYAIEAR